MSPTKMNRGHLSLLLVICWTGVFLPIEGVEEEEVAAKFGNFSQTPVSQVAQDQNWSNLLNAEGIIPPELDLPIQFPQFLDGLNDLAQLTPSMLTQAIDTVVQQLDNLIKSTPQMMGTIYSNYLKAHRQDVNPDAADPYSRPERESIFLENLKQILRHNLAAEAGKATWTQGVNRFTYMTSQEFLSEFTSPYEESLSQVNQEESVENRTLTRAAAPASLDWRQQNMVSSVKHQRYVCGSCYAFGALSCLESAYARLKNIKFYDLSEQEIVDCSHTQGNRGCGGGYPYQVYDYINANGVNLEEFYAYKPNSNVSQTCQSNTGKQKVAMKIQYQRMFRKDENQLAQEVATNGPVTVIVSAVNWYKYDSGVFNDGDGVFTRGCGNDPSTVANKNHLVLVVGYTPDYWIIKNSWGTGWGIGGYMKLKRGTNLCGVANSPEAITGLA